jgi:hypothetical protein
MMRFYLLLSICCFVASAKADVDEKVFVSIDLKEYANHKPGDTAVDGEGNDLALEPGEHVLKGIKVTIGESVLQLGSKLFEQRPAKIEGIKVDRKVTKLHILHATAFGGAGNEPGSPFYVADDTFIGSYQINYEDKSSESIPIEYGKDVRDWWFQKSEKDTSRAKVAWEGDNRLAAQYSCRVRLYLTEWKNPKPDVKIVSIDYLGRKDETVAAPFCVAITAEKDE